MQWTRQQIHFTILPIDQAKKHDAGSKRLSSHQPRFARLFLLAMDSKLLAMSIDLDSVVQIQYRTHSNCLNSWKLLPVLSALFLPLINMKVIFVIHATTDTAFGA
ncbi:hypothetical protein Cni_G24472 [Canna indica]|uniref:Uncharacterized protein n=1 Tax=Canna indica TaxID=4628 RepID=A0AAQ3QNG9_9LILI|nr:hypothetical protein Cni_G24472 [Canna indica]